MSDKTENEREWLLSVAIPHMLKTGSLDKSKSDGVRTIATLDDLCVKSIEIKFIEADEAFMLTICYRATIEYELKGHLDKRKLVVKKAPNLPEDVYDEVNFGALFNNEIVAYTKIRPAIEAFTKQPFEIPRYFYSDHQGRSAVIILEDFAVDGWRVAKEKFNLPLELALTAVKYLGEFHGIGFAMREVNRKDFDESTCRIRESRYANKVPDVWIVSLRTSMRRMVMATRRYAPSVDEEFVRKLEEIFSNPNEFGKQRVAPKEPFITLCHGDYLRNNIAFRYSVKDGVEVPTEAMMFDLQTLRVSSPMVDLTVFMMLSLFAEVRHKHFELIFESYREKLIGSYEKYAKKAAPETFRRKPLMKEYIRFMLFGLHISSFFLMNIVDPPNVDVEGFLLEERTPEVVTNDLMTRGGEVVDRELAHQVKEIYDLSQKYDVDITEDINIRPVE